MKLRIMRTIVLLFTLFSFIGAAYAGNKPIKLQAVHGKDKGAELLFVVLAKKGKLKLINKKQGLYRLTLKKVSPQVIYFTNRPERYTNKIALPKLLTEWQKGSFKSDPPNAVMEAVSLHEHHVDAAKKTVNYAIVLTKPKYEAKSDTLSFDLKALPGQHQPLPTIAKADYVALFIDDVFVCPACIN